jgi:hypothetical protein
VGAEQRSGTTPKRSAAFSGGRKVETHAKLSAPQKRVKGAREPIRNGCSEEVGV